MTKKLDKLDDIFLKMHQVALVMHPVRFKILLALYISEVMEKEK